MAQRPLGLFVTLSAYGNRLHGDERGTVDRTRNIYGEPVLPTNRSRARFEQAVSAHDPVTFDAAAREIVEAAVQDAAAFRGWTLTACHCRTNHLHVVVGTTDERKAVLTRIKARTTLALRASGFIAPGASAWARGGSGRYLWTERDVELASQYSMEAQGAPLPGTSVWREHR